MSATILSGDLTVYFTNDTGGDKQIRWTGSATGTRTLNEVYGDLQNLFDNVSTGAGLYMDEGVPMSAQTPTQYTIGTIEVNDSEPWFIDIETVKHLTGGSLTTSGWDRVTGSNTGIVKFTYSVGGGTDFAASDIGLVVTHSVGGDSGRLLHYESDGSTGTAWLRPDSNAAANDWNSTGTNVTVTSGTGASLNQTAAAVSAQESIWSNIYTLGTIANDTELYVYQNGSALTQWWDTGHFDILVLTTDFGETANGGLIDEGNLSIYARQYGKLYDHFNVNVASGGRTPIPIATSKDTNNTTGYNTISLDGATGTWNVGNYIYYDNGGTLTWSTTTKKGVITAGGSGAAPTLSYYLIGDLTDFVNNDAVTEYDPVAGANGDANGDVNGSPSATTNGPLDTTQATITVTFSGALSQDLSNGNGSRPYDVTIDCQQVALDEVYERLKYITRRGETSDIDSGTLGLTITGEAYQAVGEYYITYTTGTGTLTEGNTVSGDTSGATGTIVSNHTGIPAIVVTDVVGEFSDGENLTEGSNTGTNISIETIAPTKQSPFGTFAGGKFFGARGVWLTDYKTTDATNFELIDSTGTQQIPPNNVPIVVDGVVQNTQCYVIDSVLTEYLNAAATTNVSGNEYSATTTYGYTGDINVTIRTREMGYLPFEANSTITSSGLSVTAVFQVDPNWKYEVRGESIQFTNATSLITRTGNYTTDGWLSIMSQVEVTGSTNNDGTYTITAVGTTTITVSGTLTDETVSSGCVLTYTRREPTW